MGPADETSAATPPWLHDIRTCPLSQGSVRKKATGEISKQLSVEGQSPRCNKFTCPLFEAYDAGLGGGGFDRSTTMDSPSEARSWSR